MRKIFLIFTGLVLCAHCGANGEIFTENTPNACNTSTNLLYAIFEPIFGYCASGYYLPANHNDCVACPNDSVCVGGKFPFNQSVSQGIEYANPITTNINYGCAQNITNTLYAILEPNQYNCPAGQYLPAGVDTCTQCPANSYCVGGTYTFSETVSQGIVACDNGYHSPAGASSCTPNTITINWSGADAEDISANNAGQCTYGGDIRTPVKAQHIPGQTFVGWTFDVP